MQIIIRLVRVGEASKTTPSEVLREIEFDDRIVGVRVWTSEDRGSDQNKRRERRKVKMEEKGVGIDTCRVRMDFGEK